MSEPIVEKQPGMPGEWMPMPETSVAGCPKGLEYLAQLDQILIHQQVEIFEVLTNIEMANKYVIKNTLGQQIFFAYEESSCCHRYWCREGRGFTLHIVDNHQQEVMRIVRPFQCCAGCCWCADSDSCAFVIQVEAPPGNVIGYTRQTKYCCKPELDVQNENRECILKVRGQKCWMWPAICCTDDIDFAVKTNDLNQEIGKISKQWGGCVRETFTKADNFSITFPQDLDVKAKATLMGATILLEFMLYEHDKNNNS